MVKRKISKDEKYKNCWEYWACDTNAKQKCPVYKKKDGKKCWLYTDNLRVFKWARPKRDFEYCWECLWCQRVNKKSEDECCKEIRKQWEKKHKKKIKL